MVTNYLTTSMVVVTQEGQAMVDTRLDGSGNYQTLNALV